MPPDLLRHDFAETLVPDPGPDVHATLTSLHTAITATRSRDQGRTFPRLVPVFRPKNRNGARKGGGAQGVTSDRY
jgi:hypothetical protein